MNAGRQSIPNGKGIYRKSGGRNTYSSLASSKGAVYMNPDGTFVYLNPYKNESILSARRSNNSLSTENQQIILPVFGDDELAFFINPADLPEFVDEVLDSYLTHSRIFLVFLVFQLLIEGVYDYLIYSNKEYTLQQLAIIYPSVQYHELNRMYLLCLIGISFLTYLLQVDVVFFAIYYPLSFLGVCKKSYKMLTSLSTLSILGIFVQIFLSYINKFNMLIFFFRVFSYIYSKFLAHLVLNLILLPH